MRNIIKIKTMFFVNVLYILVNAIPIGGFIGGISCPAIASFHSSFLTDHLSSWIE
jgi:hypothetical protein